MPSKAIHHPSSQKHTSHKKSSEAKVSHKFLRGFRIPSYIKHPPVLLLGALAILLAFFLGYITMKYTNKEIETVQDQEIQFPEPEFSEEAIFEQVNFYRSQSENERYVWDDELCAIAEKRAQEISVEWPEYTPVEIPTDGLSYREIVENVASGPSSETIVAGWAIEPASYKRLHESYTHTCISLHDELGVQILAR